MAKTKEAPIGIKIIAGLFLVGAIISLVVVFQGISTLDTSAIIKLVLAVIYLIAAYGVWTLKSWGRNFAIIVAIIGIIAAVYPSLSGLGLVINLIIAGYLLFSNDAKTAF